MEGVDRGEDAASDHLRLVVVVVVKIKLKAYNSKAEITPHRFNVHSLKERAKTEEFKLSPGSEKKRKKRQENLHR